MSPYQVEEDEWAARVEELANLVTAEDDQAVLAWVEEWLPRCLALVPPRRRQTFLRGIYRYANEDGNDITA